MSPHAGVDEPTEADDRIIDAQKLTRAQEPDGTHDGEIYAGSAGRWFAVCAICSWFGPERTDEYEAEYDLEQHVGATSEGAE